jgi:hypothetical protein
VPVSGVTASSLSRRYLHEKTRIDAHSQKSGDGGGSGGISLLTMECAYSMLLFRHDLKLSFCQVHNFVIALIINFSFQGAMLFFLNAFLAGPEGFKRKTFRI